VASESAAHERGALTDCSTTRCCFVVAMVAFVIVCCGGTVTDLACARLVTTRPAADGLWQHSSPPIL
jgi:hypothetical protein